MKSAFCSFIQAISTEVRAWRHFFAHCGASFFVHLRDQIFGHTWLTSLTKMISSLSSWLLFTLIQRDKVKWMCVTLNEGYLRAANRGSKNVYRFIIKIYYISIERKDDFFVLSLLLFFEIADLRSHCGYFLLICQLWERTVECCFTVLLILLLL